MSVLDNPTLIHWLLTEKLAMRSIVAAWDEGALRTIRAYFRISDLIGNFEVENFMFTFFCKFFDQSNNKWLCRNANACAVWLCRENWDNTSLWD